MKRKSVVDLVAELEDLKAKAKAAGEAASQAWDAVAAARRAVLDRLGYDEATSPREPGPLRVVPKDGALHAVRWYFDRDLNRDSIRLEPVKFED